MRIESFQNLFIQVSSVTIFCIKLELRMSPDLIPLFWNQTIYEFLIRGAILKFVIQSLKIMLDVAEKLQN